MKGLKLLDPAVLEQIYSFRDIEEEPYTICRWLRATKFDADAILKRCEENQEMFEAAKQQDFSPNVGETIGAPFSVFLSQYPFLPIGRAKNGCPVNYFQAGRINPEGIMSMTSIDRIQGYFWWSFMWKMKEEIRKAQERDPDFVRVEGINILDLEGLSASAISSETSELMCEQQQYNFFLFQNLTDNSLSVEVIKLASKVSDFFPEVCFFLLVLHLCSSFGEFRDV